MFEVIKDIFSWVGNLIPPPGAEGGKQVYRWRLWIAGVTMFNAFGLTLHILLACGYAAPFYTGFAQAGELQAVAEQMKSQRIATIETTILDTKQKQCTATPGVKALYTQALQRLLIEYQELTKREYPIPSCENF